jgi:hypothetical protein
MALVVKDRVKETTATTGTGTLTLAGAVSGFQSFSSALSDGDTTYYAISESSTGNWEVGLGTFTASGTTLARTTVLASSNSGSAVNLTAGAADVFITQPAGKAAYFDGSGDLNLTRDPQSALQAATKQYVDTIAAAGIHYHTPVRVESPTALTATYDNGTAGVGATLTNSGTQAALVIDGITLNTSDRVLIYTQTNAAHNGIYTVTNTGSASTNWVLTRATDADSYGPSDPDALGEGDAFFVSEGNTGAGELYVMNTSGTITFGTTNINFAIVAETAVYAAGDGLTLTGTTFAVGAGTGVTVNANDIAIGQAVGTTANVTFNQVTANLIGSVTGNVTGNLTGNADTATAWATSRSLTLSGDVTGIATGIDGSGNIAVTTTIAADSVALGTDTTGNYVATGAVSGNGLSGSASAEGATFTVTSNATNANTASTIVFRDASGNFSAGTISANLTGNVTGNATTASAWATGRTLSLTGDVTGSTTIDGSGNASIAATIAANSVALGTDTTGNYVAGATQGTGVTISGTPGEGWSPTIAIGQDVATTASPTFANAYIGTYIYHSGDTNSYLGWSATDDFRIVVGGQQILRCDEGTNPDKIQFYNSSNFINTNGDFQIQGDITLTGVGTYLQFPDGTQQTTAASGGLPESTASTSSTSQTSIATYSTTSYGTIKLVISVKRGTARQSSEILIVHDGTTASATEYAQINTGSELASFDVDISGGNVRLLATATSATTTNYTIAEILVGA